MPRWAMTRVGAVQIWPEWNAHTLEMAPMAVLRSASSNTSPTPLPPSSSSRRFMSRPATSPMRWPTTVEPVKLTMSTCGEATRAAPASAPLPVRTLTTPGGNPASTTASAKREDGQRVLRRGLHDDRVAHGQRGADLAGHVHQREVVRRDGGDDADGRRSTTVPSRPPGASAVDGISVGASGMARGSRAPRA